MVGFKDYSDNAEDTTMGNQQASLNLIPVFNSTKHFIDPLGNVYSTARGHLKTLKLMPHLARGKKLYVRVKVGDTTYLAHRYIASAMVGRVLAPTEQVNHKDGDTTNNCISNLEIVSHSENVAHAVKNGLYCKGENWYKAREASTTRSKDRRAKWPEVGDTLRGKEIVCSIR
jgi:hypothetical protein